MIIGGLLALILRHVPLWVRIFWPYPVYYFLVLLAISAGYLKEILGMWKGRGSRLHKLLLQFHTGLYPDSQRSHGDERRLRRAAGAVSRSTPEGLTVYYAKRPRWYRAVRRNSWVVVVLTGINCMLIDAQDTIRSAVYFSMFLATLYSVLWYRRMRKTHPHMLPTQAPIIGKVIAQTNKSKEVAKPVPGTATVVLEKPKLAEIPRNILATLLGEQMNCSSAEVMSRLTQESAGGQITLPDHFPALQKQRDTIQEIISSHIIGKISFSWEVTSSPRRLTWAPVVSGMPSFARFRDYLPEISACKPGTFAVGPTDNGSVYIQNHNGEYPWHCTAAASGSGKSTRFLVKVVQIHRRDPNAQIYCIDTKQISFEHVKNIPNIHVFDDPESGMGDIWDVFYYLEGILRDRYKAVREGRARPEDFDDIWLLVDEGNDLAGNLKSYWIRKKKQAGDSAAPVVWGQAIAPLLRLGRQAKIRGEYMFQDITDRALGGESLKFGFSVFAMAGWKKGQYSRIIGPPEPELRTGVGKILMVDGNEQTWVQGFYDDPGYLRQYALGTDWT